MTKYSAQVAVGADAPSHALTKFRSSHGGACRPPLNQPRIRPNARRRQLRVPLASPRYLVLRWRCGDFSRARLSRISHCNAAMPVWALVVALACALPDRLLRLLRHVRPHTTLDKRTLSQLRRHRFSAAARHGLIRSCKRRYLLANPRWSPSPSLGCDRV